MVLVMMVVVMVMVVVMMVMVMVMVMSDLVSMKWQVFSICLSFTKHL